MANPLEELLTSDGHGDSNGHNKHSIHRFDWAKVINVEPLIIHIDGDTNPISGEPFTIVNKTSLAIGQKVLIGLIMGKLTIFGVGGGIQPDPGYKTQGSLIFSTVGSTTFQKADYPGLKAVKVKLVGAGGSGGDGAGAASGKHSAGGGGGGGGYAESFILASSLPTSLTVTVGRGGRDISGFNGEGGQSSSFGSLVAATGGGGGTYFDGNNLMIGAIGGSGGMGTAGDIRIDGSPGGIGGGHETLGHGGMGGSSQLGGGGRGNYTGSGSGSTTGDPGGQYGGGGAGGTSNAGGGKGGGGNGAHGVVLVELFM